MINLELMKKRLNSLQNKNQQKDLIWKPSPGKQVIRIVPYKFNPENPFIELKFHYNLNGKTYLSPSSFDRPDPIVEFSEKLKRSGDKEEWKLGRKYEPKMRTYAPIVVRGREAEGVKFWGFGKQVYEAILTYMDDPDFKDITDITSGRDVVVEFKAASDGASYPKTDIRPKPNATPAVDPSNKVLIAKIGEQINILDLFPEPTYEELKMAFNKFLHPEEDEPDGEVTSPSTDTSVETSEEIEESVSVEETTTSKPVATVSPKETPKPAQGSVDEISQAFSELFETKV
jgi:hypothetical protein